MHITALVLMFVGLWATAGCAPLNAASGHLVERSHTNSAVKRNGESILRYGNEGLRKREVDNGAIVNKVVKYTDDKIAKREDDNGPVVNQIVKYTDDEIAKREDDNGPVVNQIMKYTDDEIAKRGDGKGTISNSIVF